MFILIRNGIISAREEIFVSKARNSSNLSSYRISEERKWRKNFDIRDSVLVNISNISHSEVFSKVLFKIFRRDSEEMGETSLISFKIKEICLF